MTCNEARRMITSYVKKELPDRELEQFLRHVERCSDCMDELDTYYTVYQALDLLDSGGHHDYDLRRMLREDIRTSWRQLMRKRVNRVLLGLFFVLTEILLAVGVYTGYEVEKGQAEYTMIQRALLRVNWNESLPENAEELLTERTDLPAEKAGEVPEAETEGAAIEMPKTETQKAALEMPNS